MSKKKISKRIPLTAMGLSLSLLVSACAGKTDVQDAPPLEPTSEAALLDESEKTQANDGQVFADLQPATSAETVLATGEPGAELPAVTPAANDSESPFYDPVGGESIGRVAYTLYGKKSYSKRLLNLNPGLSDSKSLNVSDKVFFDFDGVAPQPTFLTKGLIDRYAGQLANSLEARGSKEGLSKSTATLENGETLQKLSQRLYGTTRYWTEIYLLNREKLSSYDKVQAGMDLVIYQRDGAPAVARIDSKPTPPSKPAAAEPPPVEPVIPAASAAIPPPAETASPVAAAPAAAPVAAAPAAVDPIPDTSTPPPAAVENIQPPAAVTTPPAVVTEKPKAEPYKAQELATAGGNSNFRRIIYVVLILTIAGVAFYMTRPSKKQKFDMLDVTSVDAARSKLPKDNQNKSVG